MKKLLFIYLLILTANLAAQNHYALSLDGAESFYVRDNGTGDGENDLDVSTTWTLECWLYLDSYQQYDRIFDRRTVFAMDVVAANGSGDYAVRFTERNASHGIERTLETDADNDLLLDTWYHLAVSFDGNTARLYVNDTEAAAESSTDWDLSASGNALNVGGLYNSGYSNQIDALIDEIRLSDSARSLSDMQTNNGEAPYTSDIHTILLMHLDDQADTLTYVSGTGFNGTVGDDDITAADYVDVIESLYLENRAPEIVAIADQTTDEHRSITVELNTSDVNLDALSLTTNQVSGQATLSHTDTSLTLTPDSGISWDGRGEVQLIVSDGSLSDTASFHYLDLAYQDNLNAVHLTGSQSLGINNDSGDYLNSLTDSWYLETWLQVDSSATPGDWEVLLDRRTVFSWFLIPDAVAPVGDYALKFAIRNDDALGDTLSSVAHEQVALFYGNWYHVAVGYDGNSARMWVGPYTVDSTATGNWTFSASSNALNIGGRYWGAYQRLLHGSLDELRILDQIPAIAQRQLSRSTTQAYSSANTLVLMHFDDAVAPPVYLGGMDFSGTSFGHNLEPANYSASNTELPLDGSNSNRAPWIYPTDVISGSEGQALDFTLYAFDETEIDLVWSTISTLPDGAVFTQSGNNGSFSWTPDIHQAGNYSLIFQVSDGQSASRVQVRY